MIEIGQVPAAPEHRLGVAALPSLDHDPGEVVADTTESSEVFVHQVLRLIRRYPQLLREPECGQSVGQAVTHRLDASPHLRIDVGFVDPEHSGRDGIVEVFAFHERLDQPLIPRRVRHDAHLDLAVVRGHQ